MSAPRLKLDDFQTFGEEPLVRAKQLALEFIMDLKRAPWGRGYCLTLAGLSGTGKTLLVRCILSQLRHNEWGQLGVVPARQRDNQVQHFTARFYDMRKVADKIRAKEFSIVDSMEKQSLCVLDDIGADNDPFKQTAEKLDRVLRSRAGKWTLCTANLSLAQIGQKLDPRIASALIRDGNKVHEMKTQDYSMRRFAANAAKQ